MISIANTIRANVESRCKDNAILRALGFTRGQLIISVVTEGIIYALLATTCGSIIAINILTIILRILFNAYEIVMGIPWFYISIAYIVTILLCLIAAIPGIVKIANQSIMEGFTDQD